MNRISRREALQRVSALAAGAALAPGCASMADRATAKRPNMVLIFTDDQRFDAFSHMNHPFVRTPNLDRLAEEGLRFENAFVTISLCGPSRACFLTGQHAHIHGVRVNAPGRDPKSSSPMFPEILQQQGYETAYIGKWHMDSEHANPRRGFDYWLSFRGQGEYYDPPLNENGRDFKAKGYMTDLLTDYAVNWLEKDRDKPFCLIMPHKAVHGPFQPAARHKDLYTDVKIPEPVGYDHDFYGKPEWQRACRIRGIVTSQIKDKQDVPIPPRDPQTVPWDPKSELILQYYRTLQAVDESVGTILDTLEKMGELDNTIIIFSSDNGYNHGEHPTGIDKRIMYEESIRIPMLVRYPKMLKPGTTREEMVLNIDVAPTLLDLAGAKIPEAMQGRSWVPLFRGQDVDWRDSFFYEYFQESWVAGIPTVLGVRTKNWKYCMTPDLDDIPELYDLRHDPHELNNLAENPKYADKLAEMKADFERMKKATGYTPMKG